MMHFLSACCVFLLMSLHYANGQTKEGDSCTDEYSNTLGTCVPADQCRSAKENFQQNGIRPTFCSYNVFGKTIVCCSDGNTILQTSNVGGNRPVWTSASDTRRVSERKCDEYSRRVIENVQYIPLLPIPETYSISAAKCDYTGVKLIVGGENAVRGEFPHMAAIGWANFEGGYSFNCGGSLISPKFVMSAGHCLEDPNAKDPKPVVVRLGDQNINPAVDDGADPVDVPIRRAIKHPEYRSPKKYNDIVLFELVTDVEFDTAIRPACLWTRPDFGNHDKALATGWGVKNTRTRKTSDELQKVSLSLFQNDYCNTLLPPNKHWEDGFRGTQLCAGELRGEKDTCQGDSGSPLQVTSRDNQCIFHIVGVTSFGIRCAEPGQPAVYTRVSSFVPWIESVVWPGE